jgi:DNA-binding GntR family transcriptional regulator
MSKEDFPTSGDESLRNRIFKYIKNQIITGVYGPGETLLESKLAEELGVSRTPIREAMHLLELEGLIETTAKKGSAVLGITPKDVQDIYVIRQLVEGLAASWAADRLTAAEIRELQKIYDLMEFYAQKQDYEEVADLDNKFHQIIYEASGSKILKITLGNLHQYVQLARQESLKTRERLPETIKEHHALLDAFLAKDADAAGKAMSLHAKNACSHIVEQLSKAEGK